MLIYRGCLPCSGDDIGEGVCQYLSVTDQLRIGLRHIGTLAHARITCVSWALSCHIHGVLAFEPAALQPAGCAERSRDIFLGPAVSRAVWNTSFFPACVPRRVTSQKS